jgi:hypothetical protein
MYDTVNFRLSQYEAGGVDFLKETPSYLENVGEHNYSGDVVITGNLKGLKVSLNRYLMKVKDGSLCKWYLGNNFHTMGRGDTQRAIEALSEALHLDMSKAAVTRMDIAQNIIMTHPPDSYLNHLGLLRYATRLKEPSGLYYKQTNGRLCFYDKNREQKSKKEPIPELYQNRNVLRFEQRYSKRIATQLKIGEVTGASLYDEEFYINVLDRWRCSYMAIQKINDIQLDFQKMRTKKDLSLMGILSLVERVGGQNQMIEQVSEAQKTGKLTKKQAFDIRNAIKDACSVKDGFATKSELIEELDKKIFEAVRSYR